MTSVPKDVFLPPAKLREGNVFTPVYHPVKKGEGLCPGGVCPGGLCQGDPLVR